MAKYYLVSHVRCGHEPSF